MGRLLMVVSGALIGLAVGLARMQAGEAALVAGCCGLLSLAIYWGRCATYGLLAGRTSGSPCVPYEHQRETLADALSVWIFIPFGTACSIAPFIIFG